MALVTDTLPWGRPLTADEFLALDTPDDGQRHELLPSPSRSRSSSTSATGV